MSKEKSTDISVKKVRGFLRDHPTFLDENPDILETMIVHHKPEGAISLVERQLAVLRSRNTELHDQLDSLYAIAQDNETMLERTNRLVINLLRTLLPARLTSSLHNMAGMLLGELEDENPAATALEERHRASRERAWSRQHNQVVGPRRPRCVDVLRARVTCWMLWVSCLVL